MSKPRATALRPFETLRANRLLISSGVLYFRQTLVAEDVLEVGRVLESTVGRDSYCRSRMAFAELECGMDHGPGGWPDNQSFFAEKTFRHGVGWPVVDSDDLVDHAAIENSRRLGFLEVLQSRQFVSLLRFDGNDADVRVLFLKVISNAGDRAACAIPGQKYFTCPSVCRQISGPVVS